MPLTSNARIRHVVLPQDPVQAEALEGVLHARREQDRLRGVAEHNPLEWSSLLSQWAGELATAANNWNYSLHPSEHLDQYRSALERLAAEALAALECVGRDTWDRRRASRALGRSPDESDGPPLELEWDDDAPAIDAVEYDDIEIDPARIRRPDTAPRPGMGLAAAVPEQVVPDAPSPIPMVLPRSLTLRRCTAVEDCHCCRCGAALASGDRMYAMSPHAVLRWCLGCIREQVEIEARCVGPYNPFAYEASAAYLRRRINIMREVREDDTQTATHRWAALMRLNALQEELEIISAG